LCNQTQLGFYHIGTFSECAAYFTSTLDTPSFKSGSLTIHLPCYKNT
jgi:hypothetical protein